MAIKAQWYPHSPPGIPHSFHAPIYLDSFLLLLPNNGTKEGEGGKERNTRKEKENKKEERKEKVIDNISQIQLNIRNFLWFSLTSALSSEHRKCP